MKKLLLIVSIITLTGCGVATEQPVANPDTAQESEQKTIITSFYPIEYLTTQITGEDFEVLNLTQGKDPHSYSLTPQDIQNIETSDLFIFQGAGLEPWAEEFEERDDINTLEITKNIDLLETEEHSDHEEEHSEDDHHDESEEDHDQHDHGEFDPHAWLDPVLAQEMASQILREIISIDPSNEDQYNLNHDSLLQELTALDESYTQTLSQCSSKKAVSSHDAFSYLENRYSFELFAISGLSPQSQPSSQKIQELINLSSQENITHILEEEFTDKSFSDVIKNQADLETLSINTLESTPEEDQDYITVMNANLDSLSQAFNCVN